MGVFRRDSRPLPVAASATNHAKAAPYNRQRAITASTARITKTEVERAGAQVLKKRDWQRAAWAGYASVGEIHYGFNFVANTFSRVRMHGAVVVDQSKAPSQLDVAVAEGHISQQLADKVHAAMSELLQGNFSTQVRAFALNMAIAGECLLFQMPGTTVQDMYGRTVEVPGQWVIRSIDELRVQQHKITLVSRRDGTTENGQEEIIAEKRNGKWSRTLNIGRIWRQHPQYSGEPDASMEAIADSIEELLLVQRTIRSSSRSKLNAGLIFMPDGVVTAASVTQDIAVDADGSPLPVVQDDGSGLLADIMDTIVTPINDETAASGVVPMVLTGPSEQGANIRYLTFDRAVDPQLPLRADRALERILQGIDVPKEIVSGLQDVKYANAIAIDEDLYKSNIEPLALMFSDALTDIYLRPVLIAGGVSPEDAQKLCVWYDPVEIVTRPNQADAATEGFDRFMLSGEAWRREHGFPETDAPDESELALQLLLSKGSLPEDVTQALLQVALPKVLKAQREENLQSRGVPFPSSASELLNGETTTEPEPETESEGAQP